MKFRVGLLKYSILVRLHHKCLTNSMKKEKKVKSFLFYIDKYMYVRRKPSIKYKHCVYYD